MYTKAPVSQACRGHTPTWRNSRLGIRPAVRIPTASPANKARMAGQRIGGSEAKSGTGAKLASLRKICVLSHHSTSIITVGVGKMTQFKDIRALNSLVALLQASAAAVAALATARMATANFCCIGHTLSMAAAQPKRLESLVEK